MKPAVFLDRDGTINNNANHYYVTRPEDFTFNPGVIDGIRRLNAAGYLVIVVTNQGGIAKGQCTAADVERTHAYMLAELARHGARVDAVYYCPHHHSVAPCSCRKPAPGMLLRAISEWDIDPARSVMLGDSDTDIQAATAAGVRGILVPKNGDLTPFIDQILRADTQAPAHSS